MNNLGNEQLAAATKKKNKKSDRTGKVWAALAFVILVCVAIKNGVKSCLEFLAGCLELVFQVIIIVLLALAVIHGFNHLDLYQ